MNRLMILAALFAFGLLACNPSPGSADEPRFITSTGSFNLFGGQMKVSVEETENGVIDYSVTRGESTAKTDPLIRKGSDWLLYAASPDEVWMHDGETNVLLIAYSQRAVTPPITGERRHV